MVLFTAATLVALSGRQVSDETCAAIHTWVLAVIEGEIGPIPTPIPPAVAAVALELGRAAVPTPGGAASTTIGPYSATYADSGDRPELTRDQRNRLRRAVGKGGAFQISTVPTIPGIAEPPEPEP